MHQRAREADLVVVNHTCSSPTSPCAMTRTTSDRSFRRHETVVFDEAHEIEGVAAQFFGQVLSSHQVEDLARHAALPPSRGTSLRRNSIPR